MDNLQSIKNVLFGLSANESLYLLKIDDIPDNTFLFKTTYMDHYGAYFEVTDCNIDDYYGEDSSDFIELYETGSIWKIKERVWRKIKSLIEQGYYFVQANEILASLRPVQQRLDGKSFPLSNYTSYLLYRIRNGESVDVNIIDVADLSYHQVTTNYTPVEKEPEEITSHDALLSLLDNYFFAEIKKGYRYCIGEDISSFLKFRDEFYEQQLSPSPASSLKGILSSWWSSHCILAGFEECYYEDDHKGVMINAGDFIVDDVRENTGEYGVSHDDMSLWQITFNQNDIKKQVVSTLKLAERFDWIARFFSNWVHTRSSPIDYFVSTQKIDETYAKEKDFLAEDHELACYWLLHFGLMLDKRYQEVKKSVINIDHANLQGAIEFMDSLSCMSDNYFLMNEDENLFVSRREHAVLLLSSAHP